MPANGGFWRRAIAYMIDTIILQIVTTMVMTLSVGLFGIGMSWESLAANPNANAVFGAGYIGLVAFSLVGQWLYFALLESSSWQGTLGKKALGLSVTDLNGNRIGFGRASGRYFAKILSSLILMIGYIMVAFTARKQGLHDILASTLVYKASPSELRTTDTAVFE